MKSAILTGQRGKITWAYQLMQKKHFTWQSSAPIHDKISQRNRNRGSFLSWMKTVYKIPTANIELLGERWVLEARQGRPLSPLFSNRPGSSSQCSKVRKGNKEHPVWKKWSCPYLQMTQLSTQKIPNNLLFKKSKNKPILQASRIQDKHTPMSCISISYQWPRGHWPLY